MRTTNGGRDAEQVADVGDVLVLAVVLLEAHDPIGLEGGEAVVRRLHEHAVARLGHVAYAAALLHEVEEDAVALRGDDLERTLQLLHAIAVAAAQRLAGHAGRMHAGVQRRCR